MMPAFFTSPYFVPDPDNWHLKPGAPKEIQDEFDQWMQERKEAEEKGIDVD